MSKVTLGQVATEVRESTKDPAGLPIVGLEHLIPGEIRLTQWSETSENTFTKLFHKGQVLFGRRRAYQKKAAVADFDGVCSGDITVIAAKPDRLLPDLLPFIVNDDRFFDFAMEKSAGSLSPRVKWAQLAEYAFDLPDDIEEQRSHAKLLWAIERSRSAYQNLLSQMDELVKSQFVEMFEQHHLGEKYRQLRECCSNISGGKTPSMSQKEFYGGSIPFIKSGDVKGDSVSSGALWLTDAALEQGGAVLLPKETVIVVIRSAALRHEFHVAITNNPVVINQDLKAFQPKPEFLPIYLQWAIRSHEKALLSKVQSVLTSHIEMSDLLSIPVMEANIADQERFCDFIRQTDKSKYYCQHQTIFRNVAQQVTTLNRSMIH